MDASASASTRFKNNLTFSSTLLDDIYRSIDEQSTVCTETSRKKHNKLVGNRCFQHDDDDKQRAQKLKENKACEKPVVRRSSSTPDLEQISMKCKRDSFCFNSNPRTINTSKPKPKCKPESKNKHKHDEFIKREKQRNVYGHDDLRSTDKREGSFGNTKSKVLKMYSDLKKMKQPISPGGRLTTFLNSLFVTGNNKRCDTSVVTTTGGMRRLDRNSNSVNKSTCSSISPPSHSCLTNTTSFRVNRFGESLVNKGVKLDLSDENYCVSEAGRSLLRKYQKKVECEMDNVEDEDECDDGKSDSSSDLFELDNLSPVRICSDRDELPLYATTPVHANRCHC